MCRLLHGSKTFLSYFLFHYTLLFQLQLCFILVVHDMFIVCVQPLDRQVLRMLNGNTYLVIALQLHLTFALHIHI